MAKHSITKVGEKFNVDGHPEPDLVELYVESGETTSLVHVGYINTRTNKCYDLDGNDYREPTVDNETIIES